MRSPLEPYAAVCIRSCNRRQYGPSRSQYTTDVHIVHTHQPYASGAKQVPCTDRRLKESESSGRAQKTARRVGCAKGDECVQSYPHRCKYIEAGVHRMNIDDPHGEWVQNTHSAVVSQCAGPTNGIHCDRLRAFSACQGIPSIAPETLRMYKISPLNAPSECIRYPLCTSTPPSKAAPSQEIRRMASKGTASKGSIKRVQKSEVSLQFFRNFQQKNWKSHSGEQHLARGSER